MKNAAKDSFRLGQFSCFSREFIALLWGCGAGLGFAPLHATFVTLCALAWLYYTLEQEIPRPFRCGWSFGCGQALVGLYWLYAPLSLEWPKYAIYIPAALFLLPSYVALYTGAVASIYQRHKGNRRGSPMLFAAYWVVSEWLLGHLLTGFPWTLVGYVWKSPLSILQLVSYVGIYGLSLFTVLLSALLGEFLLRKKALPLIKVLALFCGGCILGVYRVQHVDYASLERRIPIVRLVQGNVSQEEKWQHVHSQSILEKYLSLSRSSPYGETPDIIVWPEASVPFLFGEINKKTLSLWLSSCLMPHQQLLVGAVRREGSSIFNSFLGIDARAQVFATYDKRKLLPFGEYIPFRTILPIEHIARGLGMGDAVPGEKPKSFELRQGQKIDIYICSEIFFPEDFPFSKKRPLWIVNIVNDAWFGRTSEPYQHAHICRFRALESGCPLIRVANTGWSGIFTALGEEHISLPLYTATAQNALLPLPTKHPTMFSRLGNAPLLALLLFYILLASVWRKSYA